MIRKQWNFYKKYKYPNPHSDYYFCNSCNKEGKLPANFCCHCGEELEDWKKQGLINL